MHYDRICPVCGKSFRAFECKAMYCEDRCKKKAAYQRLKNDPVYQAKRAASKLKWKNNVRNKREIERDEIALIVACKDAGWSGPQTSNLILELFGWERASKVIQAVWRRHSGEEPEVFCVAAADRIPNYRSANDAFVAAMRAAPECPPEGIHRDNRPIWAIRFERPCALGGSSAALLAELGD